MLSAPGAFQAIMGYLSPGEVIQQVAVLTTGPATNWYAGVTERRLIVVQLDPVWCEPIAKTRFAVALSEVQVNADKVLIRLPGQPEPQMFNLQSPSASTPLPWDIDRFKAALQAQSHQPTPATSIEPTDELLEGARRYALERLQAGIPPALVGNMLAERGVDSDLAAAIVNAARAQILAAQAQRAAEKAATKRASNTEPLSQTFWYEFAFHLVSSLILRH